MPPKKMRKITRAPKIDPSEIDSLVEQYAQQRKARDDAAAALEETKVKIIDLMDKAGETSHRAGSYQATLSTRTYRTTDEQALQSHLPSKVWKAITTTHLDTNKLNAFVKSGEIDPSVVMAVTTEEQGAPVLRVTNKE